MDVDREVRDYLRAGVDAGRFPGASWWVGTPRHAATSRGAIGDAAVEPRRQPAHETTVYDLASLTKPLCTAFIAAQLVAEGVLDPGRSCGDLLDELSGSAFHDASVDDLAAHRAGLPAWEPLYLHGAGIDAYLARIRDVPAACDRGIERYSDLGYILLGVILERITGSPLDGLFDDRIAAPLGLRSTGLAGASPDRFSEAAPTERGNAREREMAGAEGADHPWRTEILRGEVHDANAYGLGGIAGHAGLFGTADEVAAIAGAILDSAPGVRERMLASPGPASDRTFGFVLARGSDAARGVLPDDAPGHVGFTGTSMWLVPRSGKVAVLLTNRVHPVAGPEDFQPVRAGFHRRAAIRAGS